MKRILWPLVIVGFALALFFVGCRSPSFTAIDLNKDDDQGSNKLYGKDVGMPYFLPKPYLVVTKNVHYIQTATTGLTDIQPNFYPTGAPSTGDSGKNSPSPSPTPKTSPTPSPTSKPLDKNSPTAGDKDGAEPTPTPAPTPSPTPGQASSPQPTQSQMVPGPADASSLSDGLIPQTFYTYHIEYLPDPKQKYGLKIKGGTGEARANFNLVNGWMFTGPGPLYMLDSNKADTTTALTNGIGQITGTVLQDVISAVAPGAGAAKVAAAATTPGGKNSATAGITANGSLPSLPAEAAKLVGYAEITVYEIVIGNNSITLNPVLDQKFDRDAYALAPVSVAAPDQTAPKQQSGSTPSGVNAPATAYIAKAIEDDPQWKGVVDTSQIVASFTDTQLSIVVGKLSPMAAPQKSAFVSALATAGNKYLTDNKVTQSDGTAYSVHVALP